MYFGDKHETNIDDEFNQENNILSGILKMLSKYKLFVIVGLFLIVIVLMIILFVNKKVINYLDLNGEEVITLYQGTDYIEPGFKAYNSKKEELNSLVIIKSTLDTDEVGEYEITYNDKVLNITLTDGILYDSEYKITMSDKIMSEDKYALRYTEYNFTTEIDPEKIFLISVVNDNSVEVEDFSEYRGETINVKAELNAEFPEYTFIAVLKDGDGILVAADIVENDVNAVLSVPDDADANYYVEGLLLDGMDTLSPLAKKQEKKTSLTE